MERSLLAKVGTLVFAAVLGLPFALSPASAEGSVMVASADAVGVGAGAGVVPAHELEPSLRAWVAARSRALLAPEMRPPARRHAATFDLWRTPPPEPLVTDGFVLASWYGPGFYGNRTACGLTFTEETLGVAHRTLPCGTRITLTSPAGRTITVAVIDRGPYVAGRSLDLSAATRTELGCSDLCRVRVLVE